jgi:hypothetical protein
MKSPDFEGSGMSWGVITGGSFLTAFSDARLKPFSGGVAAGNGAFLRLMNIVADAAESAIRPRQALPSPLEIG